MIRQNVKYFLWIILFFLAFILFNAWNNENSISNSLDNDISLYNNSITKDEYKSNLVDDYKYDDYIFIKTKLIEAKISPHTGDIYYLALNNYSKEYGKSENVIIFDKSDERFYYSQSGIVFNDDLNIDIKNYLNLSKISSYELKETDCSSSIVLKYDILNNIVIYKVYTFKNYSYDITIDFYIHNNSTNDVSFKHYGFIKHKHSKSSSSFFNSSLQSYEGCAVYTENKPYKKVSFDDLNNKSYSSISSNGWIAFLERYFISAMIPKTGDYLYVGEKINEDLYYFKYISNNAFILSSNDLISFSSTLFVGPKTNHFINNLSRGLELTIDYGIFWPIADPIFFLLSYIYNVIGNWGFSIILVTFLIKLLFFNLSSISYRSIGNMKKLQPRLDLLKEQYKDDKTQFSNALLNLYKKENINPLSGCLPVLVQIPVFISLYYVLLESIELRHSPFVLWIYDLSSKDPYYVLPVLMSITMFIQQKMNPPVQDQLQAKVMMFLPFVFLFLFLQFPAGLILYWIINNILSILQQFVLTRR